MCADFFRIFCAKSVRYNFFMNAAYQACWFGRSIKTFLTRSRAHSRNSSVIACKHQKPFSSVFSLGKETSRAFTAKLVIYLYMKFVSVVIQHHGILKNAQSLQPFPKVFNCSGLCRSFHLRGVSRCDPSHTMLPPTTRSTTYSRLTFRELTSVITG